MAGAWGNLLGELHAHGDDIARATGQNFTLPSADLEILWRFTAPLLTGWLADNADGADESWDLRFDFGTIRLTIINGALHHGTEHDPRPDHHRIVIDDTAAWTLAVPYQRRPITDPEHELLARRFRPL
jgi:hypothetical protein